jgi:Fe-S cluster assembly iron-binding protein IscA
MVKLMLTGDAIARLRAILAEEGDEARIRIRESRIGSC